MGPIASMLFIFESIIFLPDAVYFAMMKAIHPIIRGDTMTLQQLKYVIAVAEKGSITEAAKDLYISQPSLSGAIKEVEKEATLTIFNRCRAGVALTTEGMEFLGYAGRSYSRWNFWNPDTSTIGQKKYAFAYLPNTIHSQPMPL